MRRLGPRRPLLLILLTTASLAATLVVAELAARMLEPPSTAEGTIGYVPHPELGWLPRPGRSRVTTPEFTADYDVNALSMNDRPVGEADRVLPFRMLALGDSVTFGIGVSRDEAWPLVLDRHLYEGGRHAGRVFNGGVGAYNLGQYLQRYRMLQPVVRPHLVLVGISTATDLVDLLPPRLGGFIFGGDTPRHYFDLDASGRLEERPFVPAASDGMRRSTGTRIREHLRGLALYRALQGSMLAMRLATALPLPGGDPIWEGPDAFLRRDLSERQRFQWQLAAVLLQTLTAEARAAGARVVLVLIPHLPDAYDEVWDATFGRSGHYDRSVGARRLAAIAGTAGASFVDTTPAFIAAAHRSGAWLHYRVDKHPTADGHRLIAREIADFLRVHPNLMSPAVTP